MATETQTLASQYGTSRLYLSSGNGPVYRTVLKSPLRDALPSEIPIIDVSGLSSPDLSARKAVATEIRHAATNTGFFYIKNHNVSPRVTEAAYAAALQFFRQPLSTKKLADSSQSQFFNGYKPPLTQRLNPTESIDVRESFSWQYDPRFDPNLPVGAGNLDAIPPEVRQQLRMEDFHWDATAHLPDFKKSIVEYWTQCLALARALARSFALSLDLPETYFDSKFAYPDANLSLNYYPPIPPKTPKKTKGDGPASSPSTSPSFPEEEEDGKKEGDEEEEEKVSIGSHTDFQLFTILYQDSTGGLQVLNHNGQWISAAPIPNTFVVNIADYLQRITNDLYVSTVHRAQNWSGKERISMPFFVGFGLNESCGVLDSCVKDGEDKKYDEITCIEWVRRRAEMMHQTGSATGREEARSADKS